LLTHPRVAGVVVALSPTTTRWPAGNSLHDKPVLRCYGRRERADSVLAALRALPPEIGADALVLVHDAARAQSAQ
jgi:2-C-methyl-D-erythritol 4-phosphate cytidylyltransferase